MSLRVVAHYSTCTAVAGCSCPTAPGNPLALEPFGSCVAHRAQLFSSAYACDAPGHADDCLEVEVGCGHGCVVPALGGHR